MKQIFTTLFAVVCFLGIESNAVAVSRGGGPSDPNQLVAEANKTPVDFDGKYSAVVMCGRGISGGTPFDFSNHIVIKNGIVSSVALKLTDYAFSGNIKNSKADISAESQNENKTEKYAIKFKGPVDDTGLASLSGSLSVNGSWRRECKLLLTLAGEETKIVSHNSPITTPPPVPVPATTETPARAAAIGNVEVQSNPGVGKAVAKQPVQVTTNAIDLQKKTSSNEVWISFNPSITVQQRQFCRIVENYRTEHSIAVQTQNQIKVNQTLKNLVQSLVSLLPDGKFQGWVMRTVYVAQAGNGDAEVLMELPCNVYVGSNACDTNPNTFYGTAAENSRLFTELAKMTIGDFAITSGKFVYADEKVFDKNRSVASFGYMKAASHCHAKELSSDSDFFGIALDTISTIK